MHVFRAMGSPCQLQVYAADRTQSQAALSVAQAEIERLEAKYSLFRETSLLCRINRAAGGGAQRVDAETAGLLDFVAQAHRHSGGLFDPTAGVLREVWDFRLGRKPQPAAVTALLARIGWDRVRWQSPRLTLPAGMSLDFGGFVKEYAADAAAAQLRLAGFDQGLLNLGGDLAVLGPHPDGQPWQVGVRHPRRVQTAVAQVAMAQGALASSGDYERCFEEAGQRYCHILNPLTGWPVHGYAAVSVVAPQCLVAGVASTVAMLMAPDQARIWLEEAGLAFLCISAEGDLSGRLAPGPETR